MLCVVRILSLGMGNFFSTLWFQFRTGGHPGRSLTVRISLASHACLGASLFTMIHDEKGQIKGMDGNILVKCIPPGCKCARW